MAIERIDDTSLAMPWSPFSPSITPTSWTPSVPTEGPHARPWSPVSTGSAAKWPQRCVLCVQKEDTLIVADVPMQGLTALRAVPFGKVKRERKDGSTDKIVFEGHPFRTPTLPARSLLHIVAEFYRLGYGLMSGVRCRFAISDQLVMQRTAHPYPHTDELPKIWGVRMRGSDVWTMNAPQEYYVCLREALRHTGPRAIEREKSNKTTNHILMRHSMTESFNHHPYRHTATIANALCHSIGKAVELGWRIVGSVSAYNETSDTLMFAEDNVAACSGRAGRAGVGPVIGLSFVPSDDKIRLLILNAPENVVQSITEFMRITWGANVEELPEDEPYACLWWGKGNNISSNNAQSRKHNSSHMMLDIFSHMMRSGFVFLERSRTSPVWGDVMLFQSAMDQATEKSIRNSAQYFGVVRKGSDIVAIVRPLKGDTTVPDAIQQAIKMNWTPGLKEIVPLGKDTGDTHSFKCRGCPWSGREGSSLLSLFACQPSPSIKLTLALLNGVVALGAAFCADVTCGWTCDGDMWIFRT